ncbi:spore germination protein [Paenibacillus pini]
MNTSPQIESVDTQKANQMDLGDINSNFLRNYYQKCNDVVLHPIEVGPKEHKQTILLIYCDGMTDSAQINQFVLPKLNKMYGETGFTDTESIESAQAMPINKMESESHQIFTELNTQVFVGNLIMFFEDLHVFYTINVSNIPNRSPEESTTESSIKGPHDGFTESISTNIALVRKRLRTQSLCVETFVLSERGHNQVALLYVQDIINPEIVAEIHKRLSNYDGDAIIGTSQIENVIQGNLRSIFPLTDYIGRPDFVAECVLSGRFAVLVDGSPMAIIAPISMSSLLKSPEDTNMPFHIVSIQRMIRMVGLMIALFLPGFYVALTCYNIEQVPIPLLATIMNARTGLPLSVPLEGFLMLFLFELFHEAGARLPKTVGQTVTVVGGLIIGDAAIRAGITSPTMIVMVSLTTISTFALVNQVLSGTTSIVRLYVLMMSSLLGMFGFFIALFSIVLHLSRLESFGVPYFSPISPFNRQDFWEGLFRRPVQYIRYRPNVLRTQDPTRKEE